ncbi:hypothetical protein BT93_K1426 [Corymbia citriodora subsp. variegata]|nr:hypothetical protein BT93_K1426 [Corymbia citriodora subsp. variegata]
MIGPHCCQSLVQANRNFALAYSVHNACGYYCCCTNEESQTSFSYNFSGFFLDSFSSLCQVGAGDFLLLIYWNPLIGHDFRKHEFVYYLLAFSWVLLFCFTIVMKLYADICILDVSF